MHTSVLYSGLSQVRDLHAQFTYESLRVLLAGYFLQACADQTPSHPRTLEHFYARRWLGEEDVPTNRVGIVLHLIVTGSAGEFVDMGCEVDALSVSE
jgi:hypothetical protein